MRSIGNETSLCFDVHMQPIQQAIDGAHKSAHFTRYIVFWNRSEIVGSAHGQGVAQRIERGETTSDTKKNRQSNTYYYKQLRTDNTDENFVGKLFTRPQSFSHLNNNLGAGDRLAEE